MKITKLAALLLAVASTASLAQTSNLTSPTVSTGRYFDWLGTPRPLQGFVLFNPDGTLATISGGGGGGSGAVYGPTANGSAPANPPVLVAGWDGTNIRTISTDTLGRQILSSSSSITVNGSVAAGSTDSSNPVKTGCYASSSAPTSVTPGQRANTWCALQGQTMVSLVNPANGNTLTTGGTVDSVPASMTALYTSAFLKSYDGTNFNAVREANLVAGTTGAAGLLGVGNLGFDGTNWQKLSTDTTGKLQVAVPAGVSGTVSNNAVDGGNPVKTGYYASATLPTPVTADGNRVNAWGSRYGAAATFLTDISGNQFGSPTGGTDGQGASRGIQTVNYPYVYNGTTFDRQRDATSANNSTGTGVLATSNLGYLSNTVPTAGTAGNYGRPWYSLSGAAVIASGTGTLTTDGYNVAPSLLTDPGSTNRQLATAPLLYNGTTWDRARGDATGGAYVQERERSSYFAETTTALAASGSFNGAWRDAGATPSQWGQFTCFFRSDQASAGGLTVLQVSDDGSTVAATVQGTTLAANTPTTLTTRIFSRYARCGITNGTTAETSLVIKSQFGAN